MQREFQERVANGEEIEAVSAEMAEEEAVATSGLELPAGPLLDVFVRPSAVGSDHMPLGFEVATGRG